MTASGERADLTILMSAVEPSGDALGAALMSSLREKTDRKLTFIGCGGAAMARKGFKSAFPVNAFSVIGPVGALRAAPAAMKATNRLARLAADENAAAAVLIDAWSFSHMAAKKIAARAPETMLLKYVAPQVWASRAHRARDLAQLFDGVVTLFAFENSFFDTEDISVAFGGHPGFQAAARPRSAALEFRAVHNLGERPLLAVALGSRAGEITRHAAPFREAVARVYTEHPDIRVVAPLAPGTEDRVRATMRGWPGEPIFVSATRRFDAFAAADAALAASGTITTELAINRTPMAVAYKVHPLTAYWVRQVIKTPYISLINIAANAPIIPEFLQEACAPEAIAAELSALLADPARREAQISAFAPVLADLGIGGPPAATRAAEAILAWIEQKEGRGGN
ncbi:MAG: hypothetical protein AAGA09_04195 [Pseudomonadota bacterium]